MKKTLLVLLSTVLALSLTACFGTDNSSSNPMSSDYNSSSNPSSTIGDTIEDGYDKVMGKVQDGTYRGAYIDPSQLEISFTIKDGKFEKIDLLVVESKSADHFKTLADHLIGKELTTMDDLYTPENILDNYDETMRTEMHGGKMISAINDGLGRGIFSKDDMNSSSPDMSSSQSSDMSGPASSEAPTSSSESSTTM